ncbi:hypothetical protein HDU76_003086 [Blyttiomyces sp. JEL0837]|nr:hypothetical protein HDU76_003086 [Blyttiomyces sp. JEL0837]
MPSSSTQPPPLVPIPSFTHTTVEQVLAINTHLIKILAEYQNSGWHEEPEFKIYHRRLQANLIFLATAADCAGRLPDPAKAPYLQDPVDTTPVEYPVRLRNLLKASQAELQQKQKSAAIANSPSPKLIEDAAATPSANKRKSQDDLASVVAKKTTQQNSGGSSVQGGVGVTSVGGGGSRVLPGAIKPTSLASPTSSNLGSSLVAWPPLNSSISATTSNDNASTDASADTASNSKPESPAPALPTNGIPAFGNPINPMAPVMVVDTNTTDNADQEPSDYAPVPPFMLNVTDPSVMPPGLLDTTGQLNAVDTKGGNVGEKLLELGMAKGGFNDGSEPRVSDGNGVGNGVEGIEGEKGKVNGNANGTNGESSTDTSRGVAGDVIEETDTSGVKKAHDEEDQNDEDYVPEGDGDADEGE